MKKNLHLNKKTKVFLCGLKSKFLDNKKYFYSFLLLLTMSIFLYWCSNSAMAQGLVPGSGIKKDEGDYQLNDFIVLAVNISNWILGMTGSVALLAFIYGGIVFLISAGSSDKINQAKQIITGAIIGVIIVFVSYTVINFTMKGLGYEQDDFGGPWYQAPK